MKVGVLAKILYYYQVDLPDDGQYDLVDKCDQADPIYSDICKIMNNNKKILLTDSSITSIVREDNDEVLWCE